MVCTAEIVIQGSVRSAQPVNARERVRLAIRRRLDELKMTGRAFGRRFSANDGKGHVDTWVSGLLNGQFGLSLEELDEAAHILKVTPAQLVKSDYETSEYLTPTEHRVVEAVRGLPPAVRDCLLTLAEYLIGVAPDEVDMLVEFRYLNERERASIRHYIRAFRLAREPLPELTVLPGSPEPDELPTARVRHIRDEQHRKGFGKTKHQE